MSNTVHLPRAKVAPSP
uniref:Uncharacterized protein n=1 Tax=Arundo donax TaxID=35708 RepID=A0A0A8YET0_ARUDO